MDGFLQEQPEEGPAQERSDQSELHPMVTPLQGTGGATGLTPGLEEGQFPK